MMETKNLICLFLFIACLNGIFAQSSCVDETIVYKEGNNFFALPNAFTPNNDGINDILLVFNSVVNQRRIIITDTTGMTEIFKTDEVDATWDGLDAMGNVVSEGEYLLTLNYQFVDGAVQIGCRRIYLIRENCLDLNVDSLNFPIDFNDQELQFNPNTVDLPDCVSPVGSSNYITSLSVYPIPASQYLYINTTLRIDEVEIYEPTGKLVFKQKNNFNTAVDISSLHSGIYVLQANSQNNRIYRRFLVQH